MALTIEQIQENITNGGDVRQIINQLADYVQANPSSPGGDSVESVAAGDASITVGGTATEPTVKLSYKVYKAVMSQSGSSAPTAQTVLNTIGNIVWTRDGAGSYVGTLSGAFPVGTWCMLQNLAWDGMTGNALARIDNNTVGLVIAAGDDFLSGLQLANIEINVPEA